MGNLFQVSNQTTLGCGGGDAREPGRVTRQIMETEERARERLLRDARVQIEDKVCRAYGTLRYGRTMSSPGSHEPWPRRCVWAWPSICPGCRRCATLNELLVLTQPAHLQRRLGR